MGATGPLRDLVAVCCGGSRTSLVAARWYADLGATVRLRDCDAAGDVDRAWLAQGLPSLDDAPVGAVDVCVTDHAAEPVEAATAVRVVRTSRRADRPGVVLDEREVAAVGGVAIAVGEPGRAPLPLPPGCIDALVGVHAAAAGLAGIIGGSREIEVAAVDVVATVVAANAWLYEPYGIPWQRAGRRASGSGGCYPYGIFDAADGQVCLIARSGRDWKGMLAAAGDPDWAADPRFRDLVVMGRDYPDEVDEVFAPWLRGRTRAEIMELARAHNFPAGPVHTTAEVLELDALAGWWRPGAGGASAVRTTGRPFRWEVLGSGAGGPAGTGHRPLAGERVVDLSWVWSGPAVGAALADLGADVLKVESRQRPDNTRLRGRPSNVAGIPSDAPPLELNPYFHVVNRGKRSVALDLKRAEGRRVLQELCGDAGVVVENLSAGVVERFGVGVDWLREANPSCVAVSLRGYGDHPDLAGLRAYAPVLSSAAGIEWLVRYPGAEAVGMMTFGLSDATAAAQGTLLALAGLLARRRRTEGASVQLSQFEGAVVANGHNLVAAQLGQETDGLVPLGDDVEAVAAGDLPTSPWVGDDLFVTVGHRWLGEVTLPRLPWRFDGVLPDLDRPAPALGEHTREVLTRDLGMRPDTVAALEDEAVLK